MASCFYDTILYNKESISFSADQSIFLKVEFNEKIKLAENLHLPVTVRTALLDIEVKLAKPIGSR